jgi:thioredoxin-like negative regulator of GroEL
MELEDQLLDITEQLAKEYVGRVVFGKVNIDENHLTAVSLVFKVFQRR